MDKVAVKLGECDKLIARELLRLKEAVRLIGDAALQDFYSGSIETTLTDAEYVAQRLERVFRPAVEGLCARLGIVLTADQLAELVKLHVPTRTAR